jgi:hypothetical protein
VSEAEITGSCLCGAVTFAARAPFQRMVHCHCSRCRKASGAAHATNLTVAADRFRWRSGEDAIGRFDPPAMRRFGKWFCTRCGCPVPRAVPGAPIMVIPAGSLDAAPALAPTDHIFWGSRPDWGCASGELPTHAEYPEAWAAAPGRR